MPILTLAYKIATFILAFFLALLTVNLVISAVVGLIWMIHDIILKICQAVSYLHNERQIKKGRRQRKKTVEQQMMERDMARLGLLN